MAFPAAGGAPAVRESRRATVLAIDDDAAILDGLRLLFEDRYDVLTASNGARGLELFLRRRVDVVLLDLRMPGMSGLEVLERMRTMDPAAAVIVLTAVNDVQAAVRSVKLGALDYLTKPWDNEHLLACVAHACREGETAEGVLLVSDDWATMAPLQLALEPHVPVATTGLTRSIGPDFAVRVVVADAQAPTPRWSAMLAVLLDRYPRAAWILLAEDTEALAAAGLVPLPGDAVAVGPFRLDDLVGRVERLLGAAIGARGGRPLAPPVVTAIDLMTRHYGERFTVEDYARHVGLSCDRFAHVFREAVGTPVKEYLIRLRIAVARRILTETDHKLDEVARLAGFADASNFSRAFTAQAGIRPGEFRARFRACANGWAITPDRRPWPRAAALRRAGLT